MSTTPLGMELGPTSSVLNQKIFPCFRINHLRLQVLMYSPCFIIMVHNEIGVAIEARRLCWLHSVIPTFTSRACPRARHRGWQLCSPQHPHSQWCSRDHGM